MFVYRFRSAAQQQKNLSGVYFTNIFLILFVVEQVFL